MQCTFVSPEIFRIQPPIKCGHSWFTFPFSSTLFNYPVYVSRDRDVSRRMAHEGIVHTHTQTQTQRTDTHSDLTTSRSLNYLYPKKSISLKEYSQFPRSHRPVSSAYFLPSLIISSI